MRGIVGPTRGSKSISRNSKGGTSTRTPGKLLLERVGKLARDTLDERSESRLQAVSRPDRLKAELQTGRLKQALRKTIK